MSLTMDYGAMAYKTATIDFKTDDGKRRGQLNSTRNRIWTALEGWINKWVAARRRRETLEYFTTLDDHILKDIGLSRAAIYKELNKPYKAGNQIWTPAPPRYF